MSLNSNAAIRDTDYRHVNAESSISWSSLFAILSPLMIDEANERALRERLNDQTETAEAAEIILTSMWKQTKNQMGWGDDHLPPWADKVWDGLIDIDHRKE